MFRVRGLTDGVDYHQFMLQSDVEWHRVELTHRASLLEADQGVALVCTGIAMGVVDLEFQILDEAPPDIDVTRQWDAVAEASVRWANPTMSVAYLGAGTAPEFVGIPLPGGTSWYRLRAHAIGRDRNFDGVTRFACGEWHLVQVWAEQGHRSPFDLRKDDPWRLQGTQWFDHLPQPALEAADQLSRQGLDDAIDAVVAAPTTAQRSIAEWAATIALRTADMIDVPVVRAITSQFGHDQPPVVTERLKQLYGHTREVAEQAHPDLPPSMPFYPRPQQDVDYSPLVRRDALLVVLGLEAFDASTAALIALAQAAKPTSRLEHRWPDRIAGEAERLLKIWPNRWQDHARPISD